MKIVERIPHCVGVKTDDQLKRENEVMEFIKTGAKCAIVDSMGLAPNIERNNYKRAVEHIMNANKFDGFEIHVHLRYGEIYLSRR